MICMVPHSRITDCLETVEINEKVQRHLAESKKSWRVEEYLRQVERNIWERLT